jgi:hypothetical protein
MLRRGFLLLVILAAGCSKPQVHPRQESAAPASADYADGAEASREEMPVADMQAAGFAPRRTKAHNLSSLGSVSKSEPSLHAAPRQQAPYQAPRPVAKRMVHYSGSATLRSTEPERIIDSAIALVKTGGGYLESRSPGYAALRVPSSDFDSLFLRLLRLAEVLDHNQQAEDISEQVQDTDLRLKVVAATLERLEDLVAKARTESQKLRLLRELKRFREEKEVLESRRRDLVQRARFASINLHVQAHAPWASQEAWRQDIEDFLWIHALSPFDDKRFRRRGTFKFAAPEGMVVSREGGYWQGSPWRATSSQGSEFWRSELEVDPQGDSRFWRESIRSRLENGFKATDTVKAGAFEFCRFKSFGPTPYFYWVGVRSRGDGIDLAEFYFPNEDQQTRLLPGLLAAVERRSE